MNQERTPLYSYLIIIPGFTGSVISLDRKIPGKCDFHTAGDLISSSDSDLHPSCFGLPYNRIFLYNFNYPYVYIFMSYSCHSARLFLILCIGFLCKRKTQGIYGAVSVKQYCAEINEAARSRMELIVPELAKQNGVTEKPKSENQME